MPFENFYEESDKASRRWWKCFGLAILLFVGYWTFSLLVILKADGDHTTAEELNTEAFKKKDRVRRVDDLCRYLPLPEQFFFLEKDSPKHFNDSTSIVYRFSSNRSPEEITPFFLIWFDAHGWKSIAGNSLMFRKNRQTITITVLKPFHTVTGYEIQCYDSDYQD